MRGPGAEERRFPSPLASDVPTVDQPLCSFIVRCPSGDSCPQSRGRFPMTGLATEPPPAWTLHP
jgi:hypothetical protein